MGKSNRGADKGAKNQSQTGDRSQLIEKSNAGRLRKKLLQKARTDARAVVRESEDLVLTADQITTNANLSAVCDRLVTSLKDSSLAYGVLHICDLILGFRMQQPQDDRPPFPVIEVKDATWKSGMKDHIGIWMPVSQLLRSPEPNQPSDSTFVRKWKILRAHMESYEDFRKQIAIRRKQHWEEKKVPRNIIKDGASDFTLDSLTKEGDYKFHSGVVVKIFKKVDGFLYAEVINAPAGNPFKKYNKYCKVAFLAFPEKKDSSVPGIELRTFLRKEIKSLMDAQKASKEAEAKAA